MGGGGGCFGGKRNAGGGGGGGGTVRGLGKTQRGRLRGGERGRVDWEGRGMLGEELGTVRGFTKLGEGVRGVEGVGGRN